MKVAFFRDKNFIMVRYFVDDNDAFMDTKRGDFEADANETGGVAVRSSSMPEVGVDFDDGGDDILYIPGVDPTHDSAVAMGMCHSVEQAEAFERTVEWLRRKINEEEADRD